MRAGGPDEGARLKAGQKAWARVLACYPPWWRDRYGDELVQVCTDLRADGRGRGRLAASLLRGAVDARLRGAGLPPIPAGLRRRASAGLATSAVATVVLVMLGVAVMTHTGDRSHIVGPWHQFAPGRYELAPGVWSGLVLAGRVTLDAGFTILILTVLAATALGTGWFGLRTELPRGDWGLRLLWWAPPACAVAALALGIAHGPLATHGRLAPALLAGGALALLGLLLLSAVALAVTAGRRGLSVPTLRDHAAISGFLAATAALLAAAIATWAIALGIDPAAPAAGSYEAVVSPLRDWAGPIAAAAVVAAVVAVEGVRQARRCYRLAEGG